MSGPKQKRSVIFLKRDGSKEDWRDKGSIVERRGEERSGEEEKKGRRVEI